MFYEGQTKVEEGIAPFFRPGSIGDLCRSDSGAEKRIYFIETSGQKCLRPRQACAVESAAITNPDMTVYLQMSAKPAPGSPEIDIGEGLERQCQTMDILKKIPNILITYDDLTKHLHNTPLEPLLTSGILAKSNFAYQHLSDAVRIAMLHKFGGIYLDLDVIVFRPLRCLRNMVGHNLVFDDSLIENSILIFDQGHEFLNFSMHFMNKNYNPSVRATIGPNGLTAAIRSFCNVERDFNDLGESLVCQNNWTISLIYTEAFFPIDYFHHTRFFNENFTLSELDKFHTSFLSHVFCSSHGPDAPKTSLYTFLTERFCPSTWNLNQQLYHPITRSKGNDGKRGYVC